MLHSEMHMIPKWHCVELLCICVLPAISVTARAAAADDGRRPQL
jgi:hypothetical protein